MIVPVILSGGAGSRVWPVSRKSYPKQFCSLLGKETPFQATVLRARQIDGTARPVIVGGEDHRFIIAEQLRQLDDEGSHILLEPVQRNSAAAIAAAAFFQMETDPEAILWIMPADAAIEDIDALAGDLEVAKQAALKDYIVTFGVKPDRPETGYGYVEQVHSLEINGAFHIVRFLEKPNEETAKSLVSSGCYLWNSGMFIARARVLLEELQIYAPEVFEAVKSAMEQRGCDMGFVCPAEEEFRHAPNISIDYAVAEKTNRAVVVPAHFKWMDVGSWRAIWELSDKDMAGNATWGDVFLDNTKNCYVRSDDMVVTVSGVRDLVVVATKDAVMVTHRDHAQDVRHMVGRLQEAGRSEAIEHVRMYRPWGFYEGGAKGEHFQVKRICVNPGGILSLQKHMHRAEHWIVVEGTANVTRDGEQIVLRPNESVYLPAGCIHRLENANREPLILMEVQFGSYLGEDDIVRLDDVYHRQ